MVDLAKLTVRLEAENAKLTKSLEKSSRDVRRFETNAKKSFKSFSTAAKAAFGVISTGVLVAAAKNAFDYADSIDKAAKVSGLTAEELQELRFAGDQLGLTFKDIDEGTRRFNRRIGEFLNTGGGPAAKALERLGFTVDDLKNKTGGVRFNNIIAALAQVESQARRSALEAQLFGDDAGPKLDLLVQQGVKGLRDLRNEAQEIGAVLSDEVIDNAVQANDDLSKLASIIKTQLTAALVDLAPFISAAAQGFVDLASFARRAFGDINDLTATQAEQRLVSLQTNLAQLQEQLVEAERRESSNALKDTILDKFLTSPEKLRERIAEIESEINAGYARISAIQFDEVNQPPALQIPEFDPDPGGRAKKQTQERVVAFKEVTAEYDAQIAKLQAVIAGTEREFEITNAIAEARERVTGGITPGQAGQIRSSEETIAALESQIETAERLENVYESVRNPADELTQTFADLNTLLEDGKISFDTYADAVFNAQEEFEGLDEKGKETTDQLSIYAEQAANNMQDAFADYLFDPFQEDGLNGMLSGFVDTLRRMSAEAASAQIFDFLGTAVGAGGGGLFDTALGFLGIGGARAFGGPVSAGVPYLVGERGEPEIFTPASSGTITPVDNATIGNSLNVTVNVSGDNVAGVGRTATQIGNDLGRAINLSMRRNG